MQLLQKEVIKLTIKEIKSLPFLLWVTNENDKFKIWQCKSDGVVRNIAGILYINVYQAYSYFEGKYEYKSCDFIRIPISRIYEF